MKKTVFPIRGIIPRGERESALRYTRRLWRLPLLFVLLCGLFTLSCNQDPIFFSVSVEPPPIPPLIGGMTTNIAVADNYVFVGTRSARKFFYYGGAAPQWETDNLEPGDSLIELAGDGADLYALVSPGGNPMKSTVVKTYDRASRSWTEITNPSGYIIENICSTGTKIFAGGISPTGDLAIFRLDGSAWTPLSVPPATSISHLTGAAETASKVFITTGFSRYESDPGNGIFEVTGNTLAKIDAVNGVGNINMLGIAAVEGTSTIVAVSSNDRIYFSSDDGLTFGNRSGANFTGAIGVWKEYNGSTWEPALLLFGVRGSSYSNGYRELRIKPDGSIVTDATLRVPGNPENPDPLNPGSDEPAPTSIQNRNNYPGGLGRYPVESILQLPESVIGTYKDPEDPLTPGWEPPIFAGTSRRGLWSYRLRGEEWGWNAENEN